MFFTSNLRWSKSFLSNELKIKKAGQLGVGGEEEHKLVQALKEEEEERRRRSRRGSLFRGGDKQVVLGVCMVVFGGQMGSQMVTDG